MRYVKPKKRVKIEKGKAPIPPQKGKRDSGKTFRPKAYQLRGR